MKKLLLLIVVFTITLSSIPFNTGHTEPIEPIVRVQLVNYLGNKIELTLQPNGDYATNDANVVLKTNESYILKRENGKLSLYKDNIFINSYNTFSVQPIQPRTQLSINNRAYLGSFDFVIENNLYVRPINTIYMEDYLKGVVPIEMYPSWNLEALKTQAVAARTYAMSYMNRGIINDTISYQAYGGYTWTPNTTKAVDETTGQVLQYNGRLIDAVYSASNGGMTESNANAWGNTAVPYLTIKQDDYDPKTRWNFHMNKTQIDLTGKDLSKPSEWWTSVNEADTTISNNIKKWLNNNGYANKDIKIVSIPTFSLHDIGSGGRVSKGSITVNFLVKDMTDAEGNLIPQNITFIDTTASKLRSMIGNRVMLSFLVDTIETDSEQISVNGFGDGHGVGMSQWGAKYMGDAGKNHEEILSFYYTGTTISEMYEAVDKSVSPPTITEVSAPGSTKDTIAPTIKDVTSSYNSTTKKSTVTYSFNEDAYVTVYVKNSKGSIIQYLEKEVKKAAGKYTNSWNVSGIANGEYTFGIITKDLSNNTSSAVSKFTLDTTAPSIQYFTAVYNNSTKKVTVKYTVNETANVSVYVKNSKGTIVKYLQKQIKKPAGKYTLVWDVKSIPNGSYAIKINATDLSKNTSNKSLSFKLNKVLTGKVNANNVLIRQKASTRSKSLGKLKKYQTVTVLSKNGSWYYIQSGKIKGYVYSKYISNVK